MTDTVRLTVAQALVTFLSRQYSVADGHRRRLSARITGHLRSRQRGRLGTGVRPAQRRDAVHPGSQRAGSRACGQRVRQGDATARDTGGHRIHRPGCVEHGDRSEPGHRQPSPRAAAARRYVRDAPAGAGAAAAPAPDRGGHQCQRRIPTGLPVLRPDHQARAAADRPARRDAGPTDPVDTGAVVLSLPQDVQSHAYDFPADFFAERDWTIRRPLPDPDEVESVAPVLAAAERPLIIAGGGVIYSGATRELESLAAAAGIPVAETFAGKGAVQRRAWWQVGGIGLEGTPATNDLAREADLVLTVGARLTDFATASHSCSRTRTCVREHQRRPARCESAGRRRYRRRREARIG